MNEIKKIYSITTRWMLTIVLPLSFFLIIFSKNIIVVLFGSEFAAGATALSILSAGYLIHVAVGQSGLTLISFGKAQYNLINSIIALIANILMNLYLIPIYGINGAAIASTLTFVIVNALMLAELYIMFGIQPYNKNFIKPIAAALLAISPLFYFSRFFETNIINLISGFALLLATYLLLLLIFKAFTTEDIEIIKAFERKTEFKINFLRTFIR